MPRNWANYLTSAPTNAGRALIVQGSRLDEARRKLTETQYTRVLDGANIAPREAAVLSNIGRRLSHLLKDYPNVRIPYRLRTLLCLADLSPQQVSTAASDGRIHAAMTEAEAKSLRPSSSDPVSSVIRPTDNWNFGTLRWPRIDGFEGHGYIPGDLYANCLWYYAREDDAILDPMAGSGMVLRIWGERDEWLDGTLLDVTVVGSDLAPRGPYEKEIRQHDLLAGPPKEPYDYIIMDPPYPGIADGQYGNSPNDLANMDPRAWERAVNAIAVGFYDSQPDNGRCTVIIPNNRNMVTGERTLFPDIVRTIFRHAGYVLYDTAYASRRTQQKQGRRMAILNNQTRRYRVPMTEISEVLTFLKADPS